MAERARTASASAASLPNGNPHAPGGISIPSSNSRHVLQWIIRTPAPTLVASSSPSRACRRRSSPRRSTPLRWATTPPSSQPKSISSPLPKAQSARAWRCCPTSQAGFTACARTTVSLRHGLPTALLDGSARFEQTVRAAQAALGPAHLELDLRNRTVCAAGRTFQLPPADLAMQAPPFHAGTRRSLSLFGLGAQPRVRTQA